MNLPALRRVMRRYGPIAVALLCIVAWLGYLQSKLDLAARVASGGVVVKDLTQEIRRIGGVSRERDAKQWLLETRFGGLQLVALSMTPSVPLHIERDNHETILPVSGELAAEYVAVREGRASRHTLVPSPSTLVSYAPYTAHGWAGLARSPAAVALVFTSLPQERPIEIQAEDRRLALGSLPDVFDAERLLAQLRDSGLPSIRRLLPATEGRIAVVAVSSQLTVEPRSGPSAFWVIRGRGKAVGPGSDVLAASHLAVVPARTPVRLEAHAGTPLLLIDCQPDRVDVSGIVRDGRKLYSQGLEELLIRDFFHDQRDGTFLDVGCADYKRLSTTYYLEERLGWSGLAVDALADYAPGYAEHRPRTRFFNYLVGDVSSERQRFYRVPSFTELSSATRPTAAYLEQMRSRRGEVDELDVPTITLNDLLRQQNVSRIDLLSMDVEGHELEALAGFDIDRYRPRLFCIEAQEALADRIYEYFRGHGYSRIDRYLPFDQRNWYFAPEARVRAPAKASPRMGTPPAER